MSYILTAPKDAVNAASVGLVLWYTRVLPTLLPFVILSNILMDSNYLQYLNKITAPLVSRLIPVSDNGAFVLLSGFLFGFPIGSKNCAALLASGKITPGKPMFYLSLPTTSVRSLSQASSSTPSYTAVPSVGSIRLLILCISRRFCLAVSCSLQTHAAQTRTAFHAKNSRHLRSQMNFKIIDAGIMDGFETLTRLWRVYYAVFHVSPLFCRNFRIPHIAHTDPLQEWSRSHKR